MTADHGGSLPDLYQMLGVDRTATREEIARAWRRQARAEHPDSRPRDATAADRFRALAEAYRVLGDPARRAAYDRAAGYQPGSRATAPAAVAPVGRVPGAWLRAGPVQVENPYQAPARGMMADEETGLAVLAELVLRYLAGGRERPW